jgi:hypothetical protein
MLSLVVASQFQIVLFPDLILCFAGIFCWGQGTGTIAFDPTFGSFTLLELVSH